MLDVVCIRKPSLFGMTVSPPSSSVSMPECDTTPFFMNDLCQTWPYDFIRLPSIAVIEWSSTITNRSAINRYPIVGILSLTSVDMVFSLLSNGRLLHGMDTRPHTNSSLCLYWQQSRLRKVCNALLESNLNHNITIKHLRITVGEYIWSTTSLWW
jgi:hypothetical protein